MTYSRKHAEEYEKIVTDLLQSPVLEFEIPGNKTINFANSKALPSKQVVLGAGDKDGPIKHQIDVQLVSKKDNAVLYGECKCHAAEIEKNEVSAFIKVIDNIKELEKQKENRTIIPVFISNSPFQDGARKMLEHYGFHYIVFSWRERPHFVYKDIEIESFFSRGRWHSYKKEMLFYNDRMGTAENLGMSINEFLFYESRSRDKSFEQSKCTIGEEYKLCALVPESIIVPYVNGEIVKEEEVIKIRFKYTHRKETTVMDNPEIGVINLEKKYVVYKNLKVVRVKKADSIFG